jgi:hypothetical protein
MDDHKTMYKESPTPSPPTQKQEKERQKQRDYEAHPKPWTVFMYADDHVDVTAINCRFKLEILYPFLAAWSRLSVGIASRT